MNERNTARRTDARPGENRLEHRDEVRMFEERDLRTLGWYVLERLYTNKMAANEASAAGSLIRALAGLGEGDEDAERLKDDIVLHGLLYNGFQPRTPEEWQRAEELFGPERLAEFERWRKYPAPPAEQAG